MKESESVELKKSLENLILARNREAQIFIATFNRPSYDRSDTIDKTIDKSLSVTEKAVIELITANPSITQKEMARQLGLSEIGIRFSVNKLNIKGMLQRIGGKKAGRWEVDR